MAPITEPFQEEATAPVTLDSAGVDVLYHSIFQHRPLSTGDLMVTDEAASTLSTVPILEQIGLQLESTSGPVSIPTISSAQATTGLQLIINSRSPTLVFDQDPMITNPASLVASTLVSQKTPLRLPSVPSVLLTVAPMTTSMIMTTKLSETSPLKHTRSP